MKHEKTTCNGSEVVDPKFIEQPTCRLNFNGDQVEFEFQVKTARWQEIDVQEKTVSYEVMTGCFEKYYTKLEMSDESDESSDLNYTTVSINCAIKDVLLNLFSPHKKEFKLTVDYIYDSNDYQTILYVLVPEIDQK